MSPQDRARAHSFSVIHRRTVGLRDKKEVLWIGDRYHHIGTRNPPRRNYRYCTHCGRTVLYDHCKTFSGNGSDARRCRARGGGGGGGGIGGRLSGRLDNGVAHQMLFGKCDLTQPLEAVSNAAVRSALPHRIAAFP